jgi:hypothetical protein
MAKGWGWPDPHPCRPASLFLLFKKPLLLDAKLTHTLLSVLLSSRIHFEISKLRITSFE